MGSTSAENSNNGSAGVGRRDLIKRSAALGLISVPTMSFLSACASSGGDDSGDKAKAGKKTAKNPWPSTTPRRWSSSCSTAASARSTPRTP